MATLVRDLMSQPPITCSASATLAEAAEVMHGANVGSVIVITDTKVAGILTERDLLRAAASHSDPSLEHVHLWMTAHPDVLGPEEEVAAAWSSLSGHHYRHLPVVTDGELLGVVSIRDLMGVARIRPADEPRSEVPKGLEGVVVASTTIGDVRGEEGFFHYHQYSAVELAEKRTFEDVWHLLFVGDLPDAAGRAAFDERVRGLRALPPGLKTLLPLLVSRGAPLEILRTSVSLLGSELGWRALRDVSHETVWTDALGLCAVVPTILAAAWRLRQGLEPLASRSDLGYAANYLWMLTGTEPTAEHARAVEQYLMLTVDHGFNASTFTARVITSTEADLAGSICGAIGALSGPLHGGAPSRALDMLEAIGSPELADAWLRAAVERGDRLMGFGHRVYKTEDPRSHFLRQVAQSLGGPLVDFAMEVEQTAVAVLAELKPGHRLYTNVEFFAGVVMESCGIPREMFTPTFAISRTVGWCVHVLEQAADNRLIRPSAHYVGPPAPQQVPQI